jgi:hypothetical protein
LGPQDFAKDHFFQELEGLFFIAVDDNPPNPPKLNQLFLLKGNCCLPALKHNVSANLESTKL